MYGAGCLNGREKINILPGQISGKRPQDAVLEKAMVALGQTSLSRDD